MPRAARAAAISRASPGAMVLMSTTTLPGARPSMRPASPRTTLLTSLPLVTTVNTISARRPTSAGVAATAAPISARSAVLAGRRPHTVRG